MLAFARLGAQGDGSVVISAACPAVNTCPAFLGPTGPAGPPGVYGLNGTFGGTGGNPSAPHATPKDAHAILANAAIASFTSSAIDGREKHACHEVKEGTVDYLHLKFRTCPVFRRNDI